jgi:hypothetical protein
MQGYDPLGILIASDRIHGWASDVKFGNNTSVGTAWEALWAQGGSPLVNDTATIVEFISSSGSDAGSEAGARTISFSGVDADFVEQTEVITLTGATPASSAGSFLYVHRMSVRTSGSILSNVGVVSAKLGIGASTFGTIPAGSGQSEMLVRAVPAGATLYLTRIAVSVTKEKASNFRIIEYDQNGTTWRVMLDGHTYEATSPVQFNPPYKFGSKCVVWVTAKSSVATDVDGWFEYVILQGDT